MAVFHDEVEIEDFQYDEDSETYFYPCPCGDNFCITKEDLENGEDVATCPSCSLIIKVIYDKANEIAFETGVRIKALQLATVLSALPQNRLTAPKRQSIYNNSWFAEDELEDEMPTLNKYVPGDASNKWL